MSLKPGKPSAPFGLDGIKQCIPHRDPMLMVTKVLAYGEDWIDIEHHVAAERDFFKGHFPGKQIMPGVLIIETCAQAGALLVDLSQDIDPKTQFMAFSGVDKAKFRKPVQPGDTISVQVKIARKRGGLYKFEAEAATDSGRVASVDFTASVMKF